MWKRLSLIWTLVRGDARRLWFALRHPAAPGWLKWATGALLLYLLSPQPVTALLSALGGCATGLAVLLPFYLLRGMAAGDVKMMAAVGVFTGAGDALRIAILAWCAGGVMVLVVLIVRGRLRLDLANLWAMLLPILLRLQRLPSPSQDSGGRPSAGSIPYGVAIAAGTIVHLVGRYGATHLA